MAKKSKNQQITVKQFFASIQPQPEYVKHLVECRCFLPQFKDLPNPINHKFVVFSELDDVGGVKPSFAQCNNCGIIHRVIEVSVSETLQKEESKSLLPTKEEIATSLPAWLKSLLEKYECDLHVWQEAQFIYLNHMWGRVIILSKEKEGEQIHGKICQILGESMHKIEAFEREV